MEILVNTYGTKLRTKGERMRIITPDKKEQNISSRIIDKVVVNGAASVSTGVFSLAQAHNIDLVFLDNLGKPIGRFVPYNSYGTADLRHAQVLFCKSDMSVKLARKIIESKGFQQVLFLEKMKERQGLGVQVEIDQMKNILEKLTEDTVDKQKILGYEGSLADRYFGVLRKTIPFGKRGRGARDVFNASLNYAYAILYSEIEKACVITGLDPTLGFLHEERYGKKSLVLDLMEEFRVPFVDQVVCQLFLDGKIKMKDSIRDGEVYVLSKREKGLVAQGVLQKIKDICYCGDIITSGREIIKSRIREISGVFQSGDTKIFQRLDISYEK